MNPLDIGVLAMLAYQGLMGFRKGLIRIVLDIVVLTAAVMAGILYREKITQFVLAHSDLSPAYASAAAFLWIIAGALVLLLIVDRIAESSISATALGPLNPLGGLAIGVIKGAILVVLILIPVSRFEWDVFNKSQSAEIASPVIRATSQFLFSDRDVHTFYKSLKPDFLPEAPRFKLPSKN